MEASLDNNMLNVDMRKVKPFDKFELGIKINAYPSKTMSPISVVDTKVEICAFLESFSSQYKLLQDLYKNLMKFGNFNEKCPFDKVRN